MTISGRNSSMPSCRIALTTASSAAAYCSSLFDVRRQYTKGSATSLFRLLSRTDPRMVKICVKIGGATCNGMSNESNSNNYIWKISFTLKVPSRYQVSACAKSSRFLLVAQTITRPSIVSALSHSKNRSPVKVFW